MSAFTALLDAIEAVLTEAPLLVPAGQVVRMRELSMPDGVDEQILLLLGQARGEAGGTRSSPTDWTTPVIVEMRKRVPANHPAPDAAIDTLLATVYQRLATAQCSGVMDVMGAPEIGWLVDEADGPYIRARIVIQARHCTQAGTLTPSL